MKTFYTTVNKIQILVLLGFFSLLAYPAKSAEFVIMNRVISWDVNSTDAFWTIPKNAAWPANWLSPDDYYHGLIYTRYEVLSVATNSPFRMQFGIFQFEPAGQRDSVGELCELTQPLQGNGSVAIHASSPSAWWQSYGGVDFSRVVADFQSMSAIIYSSLPDSWPVSPPEYGGEPNGGSWAQRLSWFPVTLRVTVVAVSMGSTFSGWDNYIIPAAQKKPTPTYGIDYLNETTDKVVPTTDEYSQYPTMSGAVSGTGKKIAVPPGQRLYFRTKAADGLLASEIQILVVPIRPATPVFASDNVNHRTTTAVNNNYESCDFVDFKDAVTGNGTAVNIPAGTTKYFRKKATVSSFASKVQALSQASLAPLAHEFAIFNDYADFPNNTDTNGFYYFYYNADMPVNWMAPENYYGGMIYIRYEIVNVKTTTPIGLQFGIWQMTPPETGELHETMSEIKPLSGNGAIATSSGSLSVYSNYWRLDQGLDFTRMNLTWHFGILPWKANIYDPSQDQQIRQEVPSAWNERNISWFPMKVRITIIAVASGYNFSGWNNYLALKPAVPSYSVDFAAGKTSQVIASTDEYSYSPSMSPAYQGTGAALDILPGQTVYFRTKAQGINPVSDIQRLVVPVKPAAPAISVDFELQETAQNITPYIEYDTTASFTNPSVGAGSQLPVTPGQDLYFRQKGSDTSFVSDIMHLAVPNRIQLGYTGADTISADKFTVFAILNGVVSGLTQEEIQATNGTVQNLQNGNTFDVYPVEQGPVSVVIPLNAIAGSSFASNVITVQYEQIPTGVKDLSEDAFSIYPNPTKDRTITIQSKLNIPYQLKIYSVDGSFIKTIEMNSYEHQNVNFQDLQKGMYFLKINSEKGVNIQKLVLE